MTERTRTTNKSSAKGRDTTADRNADGMAISAPAVYETTGYNRLSLEETMFLDAYAETKADLKACAKVAQLTKVQINNMLKKESVRREIEEIQKVWRLNRRMKAENAAAKHIELMDKLEADYDEADPELRAKFANPLMKGSETYLKAAGHMNHGGGTGGESQVIINIDLGGDETNERKLNIDGQRVSGGEATPEKKVKIDGEKK